MSSCIAYCLHLIVVLVEFVVAAEVVTVSNYFFFVQQNISEALSSGDMLKFFFIKHRVNGLIKEIVDEFKRLHNITSLERSDIFFFK